MSKVFGPELKARGLGCKAELTASPAALASLSSPLPARVLIKSVPSMGCAKQADNPLIHKPPHCHAISRVVDGGGEDISSVYAISVCCSSIPAYRSFFLDFPSFPHDADSHFCEL